MCVGIAVFMAYVGVEEFASAGAVGCRLIAEAVYGVVATVVEPQGQGLDEGDALSCWSNLLVCCAGKGLFE
jgi:hypothetical protein